MIIIFAALNQQITLMIKIIRTVSLCIALIAVQHSIKAQAPSLGTAADFVLFSANGAVSNTGITHLTGNVGTNNGSSTAFGNVNGQMHDQDGVTAQCAADLLTAYNQLNSRVPNFFPAPALGNGQTLVPGVYSINGASTINLNLILNGQGNTNAVFIFKIQGPLSTNANAKIKLINGAQACKIFWKVEGLVSLATGTTMRGTIIANNSAIIINSNDTLEGRALSTTGAVTVNGILGYLPTGCGAAVPAGPVAPDLRSTACYSVFSSNGAVSNSGVTTLAGDVGTNTGLTTGYDPLLVSGTIHPVPDGSTARCASDLALVYTYLNTLPHEIQLLYPAQFGNNLVLTPHTYLLDAATVLTDTVVLDGLNNPNAVFVIKIDGALSTSTYSKVKLINNARAENVYWKVDGAVSINNYSVFCGTLVCNNAALGAINTSVTFIGRALTTNGALTTSGINCTMAPVCVTTGTEQLNHSASVSVSPNPFNTSLSIVFTGKDDSDMSFTLYNCIGNVMANKIIHDKTTVIETNYPQGVYYYRVTDKKGNVTTGKLVCN